MKTYSYQHLVEKVNNSLLHIYTAKIESNSKHIELIKNTLENLMRIHFENEAIRIRISRYKDNLYIGEYVEAEHNFDRELQDFATLLQSYTKWDQEFCELITNLNYTPITTAISRNRDTCLYYNSDDLTFEMSEFDPEAEYTAFEINNHTIILYID